MSRMFGTDGVRGIANKELTAELAYKLGRAGAFVLTEGEHKPKILVGKDTRISGDMLESALVAGILSVGGEAIILGVIPTPAVAHLTRKYNADAGIMISASHNPVEYNGIKFFDNRGYKLPDDLEDEIQRVIESGFEGVPSPTGTDVGKRRIEVGALDDYKDFAKNTVAVNFDGLKIALDCANGANYKAAVDTFRDLGADVYVINDNPDGTNINEKCGSTHPEELMEYVVKKGCDVGFAFDGDADRCLAIDEKGNLINGDMILALCGKHLKTINRLKDDTVVVTVMSNLGLDIAFMNIGINAVKTKVGDRYVLEEMIKGKYVLGGEQSGHIIFLEYNTTGDGLVTALQVASIIQKEKKSLSKLCSIMKELPQVLVNAKVPNEKKNIYLEDEEIKAEIERIEKQMQGRGRVLIRPSGTEPLVRVMLEGEDQEEINKIAQNLADMILDKCR
ncbi:MAG: phosphoglucosamine mutase [Clostridium sp.]|nr:phosphoglucosamine mutase [Clostridium sp.]MDY3829121.1 phosphoglucosamine mutase [Clostridium sp.]